MSSTGHLIIASGLMGLNKDPVMKDAVDDFNVIIQGGAILAVVGLYLPRFIQMVRGLMGKDPAGLRLLVNLMIAFTPAAAVGFVLSKTIKANLFHPGPVIGALIIGGVFMIVLDRLILARWRGASSSGKGFAARFGRISGGALIERDVTELKPRQALLIGVMQIFAMWPGTSRSMMTICGGVLAGLPPAAAAEFSFLLGVPTLVAATGYDLFKNLRHAHKTGEPNLFEVLGWAPVLIGVIVAALSAAVAVRWLVGFLNKHGLTPFGIYRILLGILLLGLINRGLVTIEPPLPPASPPAVGEAAR